jgi:hypothetical protein
MAKARARAPRRMMANAASPEAYVAALEGWRLELVAHLRSNVLSGAKLEEGMKYGNLFYSSNGPAVVIRAEDKRVLLAFFRGKRLRDIEPRLVASGKYELANLQLLEGDAIAASVVRKLTRHAVALNRRLGDPTKASRKRAAPARRRGSSPGGAR